MWVTFLTAVNRRPAQLHRFNLKNLTDEVHSSTGFSIRCYGKRNIDSVVRLARLERVPNTDTTTFRTLKVYL